MKVLGLLITSWFLLTACSQNPEPLQFGKDSCHHCKMTLMDSKFGAEIVTAKSKVHKFDDINCMVNFINAKAYQAQDLTHIMVIDLAKPGELIGAETAFFVKSNSINTPMGSGIVAFANKEGYVSFINEKGGNLMNWEEVRKSF